MGKHHHRRSSHRRIRNIVSRTSAARGRRTAAFVAVSAALLVGGTQLGVASASAAPSTGFVRSDRSIGSSLIAVQPVSGVLTSSYGPRWGTHHNGIDIGASIGTPIYSAAGGVVISAGPASGFGLWVRVQHDDGAITVYGHIDTYTVSVGQRVAAGKQIATVGNRGQSTGPHLHFEAWEAGGAQVDPERWLRSKGVTPTW